MPCPVITVKTASGDPRDVPTKWCGQWLAVHRPVRRDGLSTAPALWALTLRPLGLAAPELAAPLPAVLAMAKLWDTPRALWGEVVAAADASAWRWRDRFRDDVNRVRSGRPALGPRKLSPFERLEAAGTPAEVEAAVAAAMGALSSAAEDAKAFPVAEVLPAHRVRFDSDGWPQVRWGLQWFPAPTVGEAHAMALDSVAETPAGVTVESDNPHGWPCLLGLI